MQSLDIEDARLATTWPTPTARSRGGGRLYRTGERSELLVVRELHRLGPDWRVLNSRPLASGGCDAEHLVIGPGGVFSLSSMHHHGSSIGLDGDDCVVDGQSLSDVKSCRLEAKSAAEILSETAGFPVPTVGVLVVVQAASFIIKRQPADVHVVSRRRLAAHLLLQPIVLDLAGIGAVFAAARRQPSWRAEGA
jgi:hypothetical protein